MAATTEPGGGSTALTYDPQSGELERIDSPGSIALELESDGPLPISEKLSGPVAGEVSRGYDSKLRVDQISINGKDPVAYGYDADSLVTSAGDLSLTRDQASGRLTATSLGQVASTHAYNAFGELESQDSEFDAQDGLYSADYVRDAAGRITEKTEITPAGTVSWDYTYDSAGRLADIDRDGSLYAAYDYDANSNRISGTGPGGPIVATYDDQDRLQTYGDLSFTYTPNGELKRKTDSSSGEITNYDYDALGNLDRVQLPDGTEVTYLWDGLGRRVARLIDGQLQSGYLYEGAALNPIAELDDQGNVVSRFIYGSNPRLPDYMLKGGRSYRILADQLGSPRLVVDSQSGQIAQQLDYGPFGEVIDDTSPGFQPFGFAAGQYDPDTGMVRFGARDYDAEVGRWTNKDPILFAGGQANLYGYVINDPVNLVDPSGLLFGIDLPSPGEVIGAVGDAAGAVAQVAIDNKFLLVAGACIVGGPACYVAATASFLVDTAQTVDQWRDGCIGVGTALAHIGISAVGNGSAAGLSAAVRASGELATQGANGVLVPAAQMPGVTFGSIHDLITRTEQAPVP